MNKVFEKDINVIENILPAYIDDLIKAKVIDTKSFTIGITKAIQNVPNVAADIPYLFEWLSGVILQLYDAKLLNLWEVQWIDKKLTEDEMPLVEDYLRLMAEIVFKMT